MGRRTSRSGIRPIIFQLDTQSVSNAVHVGVIGDDLCGVQDGAVAKAGGSQAVDVGFFHVPRFARELGGVIQ